MKDTRLLTDKEKEIIAALIGASDPKWAYLKEGLSSVRVSEMDDGGMGSLLFEGKDTKDRKLGNVIGNAEFDDRDGTPVSLGLNIDEDNQLFELDVWKVDYSRLISFPNACELKFQDMTKYNSIL